MEKEGESPEERKRRKLREAGARYRARHPERIKAKPRGQMEPAELKRERTKDLRSYYKRKAEMTPIQITALKERRHGYYLAKREERLAKQKAYRKANVEKTREAVRTANKKARLEDPEGFRERQRLATKAWRAKNPEKIRTIRRAVQQRRFARKRGAQKTERIDLAVLAERDGWRCHLCGKRVTKKNWSMDHLIPVSHGGDHTYANVALAHHRCNSRRSDGRLPAQLRLLG